MAVSYDDALRLATQIVAAAATQNAVGLKFDGVPAGDVSAATEAGKKDGAYIAAMLKTIATGIKTI